MKEKLNSIIKEFTYKKLDTYGIYEITLIMNTDEIIIQKIFISDDDVDIDLYINTFLMYLF